MVSELPAWRRRGTQGYSAEVAVTDERRATLFYDADCGFCTRAVAALLALGRRQALRSEPIRSPVGDRLLSDLPESERYGSWHLIEASGRRTSAGAVAAPLLRLLPALAWLVPLLEACPGEVDAAYRLVARNRGRLSRALGADRCTPPS